MVSVRNLLSVEILIMKILPFLSGGRADITRLCETTVLQQVYKILKFSKSRWLGSRRAPIRVGVLSPDPKNIQYMCRYLCSAFLLINSLELLSQFTTYQPLGRKELNIDTPVCVTLLPPSADARAIKQLENPGTDCLHNPKTLRHYFFLSPVFGSRNCTCDPSLTLCNHSEVWNWSWTSAPLLEEQYGFSNATILKRQPADIYPVI